MLLHLDGDSFFAACEQAAHPQLAGKPVVVGKDRNIILAASYEAKVLGIRRGISLWEAKIKCPKLVVLPSDFDLYSKVSQQLVAIVQDYTPTVEEYSVDEVFADLTGTEAVHGKSYAGIAEHLQNRIYKELDITVSVGVSLTKTLAKSASHYYKPAGLLIINRQDIPRFLDTLPIQDVWNIGRRLSAHLQTCGIKTARQFSEKPKMWVAERFNKTVVEIWQELRGYPVFAVDPRPKLSYKSISKIRTFSPSTTDADYLFAQLLRNVENACYKARVFKQAPKKIIVILRRDDFKSSIAEAKLIYPSAFPTELTTIVRQLFTQLFQPETSYRATSIILSDLTFATTRQSNFFQPSSDFIDTYHLYEAVDYLRDKYGRNAVYHAGSHTARLRQPTGTLKDALPIHTTISW